MKSPRLRNSDWTRSTLFASFASASKAKLLYTIASATLLLVCGTGSNVHAQSLVAPALSSTDDGPSASSIALAPKTSGTGSTPAASDLSVSLGASAWTGDYGSSSTTDISAELLSARYRHDSWRLSATLPYTRITTAGNVFLGLGATPVVQQSQALGQRRVNEGIGDVTFGLSYLEHALPRLGIDVEWLGAVKVPTASSSSRISTGQVDFSVGAEITRASGPWVPFASVIYRNFGSTQNLPLQDGFATSIGASYLVSPRALINLSYEYARSASRLIDDSHELVASASYKLTRSNLRLSSYFSAGLSDGAAAVSGGLSVGRAF